MTKVTVNSQRPSVQTQNIGISAASQAQVDAGTATGVYVEPATLANWTGALPSQTGNNGKYLTTNGTTASWATVSAGGTSFIGLTDVPASFSGASLKLLRVNSGETALEFFTAPYINSSGSTSITNVSINAVGPTNSILIGLDDETIQSNSIDFIAFGGMSIRSYDGVGYTGNLTSMLFSGSVLQVSSTAPNWTGITYSADYSAGYTSRSLIDKGYATSTFVTISGGSYWSTASGGTLTGANTITGTGQTLKGVWNNLGTTQTDGYGWWLANTTAATSGNQQISPSIVFDGQGWKTTATAASQSVQFIIHTLPVQGTTSPTGFLVFNSSINGSTNTQIAALGETGNFTISGNLSATGSIITFSNGRIQYNGTDVYIDNQGSGNINFRPQTSSQAARIVGATLDFLIGSTTDNARLYVVQSALSASWKPAQRVDPGAHTGQLTTVEYPNFIYETATQTGASGTVPNQRNFWIKGITYAGTSGTRTATDAYGLYVESHIVGSNAAITNNWAIGCIGNFKVTGTRVNMASLPTSSAGLATGDIWNNSGVINIV